MRKVRVWIDDERLPPMDYDVYCSTAEIAKVFLDKYWGHVTHISFDHDLGGESYGSGYDVIKFIEEKVRVHHFNMPFTMEVHSQNPVGRKNIQSAIDSINQYKSELTGAAP